MSYTKYAYGRRVALQMQFGMTEYEVFGPFFKKRFAKSSSVQRSRKPTLQEQSAGEKTGCLVLHLVQSFAGRDALFSPYVLLQRAFFRSLYLFIIVPKLTVRIAETTSFVCCSNRKPSCDISENMVMASPSPAVAMRGTCY